MTTAAGDYPVRFDVDYQETPRNRMTVFFRIFTVIPILVVFAALSGGPNFSSGRVTDRSPASSATTHTAQSRSSSGVGGVGIVVLPTVLMLVFRQKYPRWWFDWNLQLSRFGARVGSYLVLLRDEYPSTDDEQAIHLAVDYPDAAQLNRWLPLVKWLLALPHYIVLVVLYLGVFLVTVIAWFAVLITGRYPRGLFEFVVGVHRWGLRVGGYAFLLVTDRYPPFSTR